MNNKQVVQAQQYLVDFLRSINNRSLSSILFSDFFKKILEGDLKVWQKDMEFLNSTESPETWFQYSKLLNTLDTTISSIFDRVLKEQTMDYYYFFDCLSKHVETFKDEKQSVKGADRYYAEHILRNFYRDFFAKVSDSPNRFNIWESFPTNWRVTVDSISDAKNILSLITLDNFFQWAHGRISSARESDFDKALEDASEKIFPEVDPIRWSKFLIFTFSSFDPEHRVESVIKRPWNFGLGGRVRTFGGSATDRESFEKRVQKNMAEMDKVEKKKTFEMVKSLSKLIPIFHHTFTVENLNKFISEAKSLENKYEPDSYEENKRRTLLNLFSEFRESMSTSN